MVAGYGAGDLPRSPMSTPLHQAVKSGNLSEVKALLAGGSDPNAIGKAGATPLALAALRGHTDCAEALLLAGADPNLDMDACLHPSIGPRPLGVRTWCDCCWRTVQT